MIDIKDLNKAEVLAGLYNASRPQGMGFITYDPIPMQVEEAESLLKKSMYFDYLKGRVMKLDLSGDSLDPWLYDRDNGKGMVERIIKLIRSKNEFTIREINKIHKHGKSEAAALTMNRLHEETRQTTVGNTITMRLGLADVANKLLPAIKRSKSMK